MSFGGEKRCPSACWKDIWGIVALQSLTDGRLWHQCFSEVFFTSGAALKNADSPSWMMVCIVKENIRHFWEVICPVTNTKQITLMKKMIA